MKYTVTLEKSESTDGTSRIAVASSRFIVQSFGDGPRHYRADPPLDARRGVGLDVPCRLQDDKHVAIASTGMFPIVGMAYVSMLACQSATVLGFHAGE